MHRARVLMVCMGNICRSPMAEAVFRQLVARRGLDARVEVDSAGTGSWHVGSPPHPSTQQQLAQRAISFDAMQARQLVVDDLERFDYVVAMDSENLDDIRALARDAHAHVSLLLEHATGLDERDVPDPYYVGGYDRVYELVVAGCAGLLDFVCEREGLV